MIELIFVIMLAFIICQGFICAANICPEQHQPIVRLLVIIPTLIALFTLHCMVDGSYQTFPADILRAVSTNAVYVLITGHLLGKSWLGGGER